MKGWEWYELATCDGHGVMCGGCSVHNLQLEDEMSWFARKYTKSDIVNDKEVIKEYFDKKNQKYLTEVQSDIEKNELQKFWEEFKEDHHEG